MTQNKKYIIWGLIAAFIIGIGLYNPEVKINISENTINTEIEKRLPINSKVTAIGLTGTVDELRINFKEDGKAYINFEGYGELTSGTTFSAEALATSGLFYEDGKLYLEEPWIEEVYKYDYELEGKEKAVKDAYRKGQDLFNKVTGKEYQLKSSVVEKAKDKFSMVLEYIPVYNINEDNSIKGFILQQATGDVVIEDGQVTAILKPFGLLLKGVLFGAFIIVFTIAAIRNPDLFVTLIRLS